MFPTPLSPRLFQCLRQLPAKVLKVLFESLISKLESKSVFWISKTRKIFERGLEFDDFLIFGQRRVLVLAKLVDVGVQLDDRIETGDRCNGVSNPLQLSSEVVVGEG